MKRSVHVSVPLLAAAAFSLTAGCRRPQMQRCVDEQNHVVDDKLCQNLPNQQPGTPIGFMPYHFYYGGFGSFTPGTIVTGGTTVSTPGVSYTTRGGFGSSYGGSGSGSGAHGEGAGE